MLNDSPPRTGQPQDLIDNSIMAISRSEMWFLASNQIQKRSQSEFQRLLITKKKIGWGVFNLGLRVGLRATKVRKGGVKRSSSVHNLGSIFVLGWNLSLRGWKRSEMRWLRNHVALAGTNYDELASAMDLNYWYSKEFESVDVLFAGLRCRLMRRLWCAIVLGFYSVGRNMRLCS